MLKADKLRFEKLRSTDEAVRVVAATELEEKRRQYFFEHMIDLPCNTIHHEEWVRSYRETKSEVAMKALHDHPDPKIRWQVSESLFGMAGVHGLDYESDAPKLSAR